MRTEMDSPMTSAQYDFAIARIKELQNPALQPLGLALAWELNELMTQTAQYEYEHDMEMIARLEAEEDAELRYMAEMEERFLESFDR